MTPEELGYEKEITERNSYFESYKKTTYNFYYHLGKDKKSGKYTGYCTYRTSPYIASQEYIDTLQGGLNNLLDDLKKLNAVEDKPKDKKWLFNKILEQFEENNWYYPEGEDIIEAIEEFLFDGKISNVFWHKGLTFEKVKALTEEEIDEARRKYREDNE